MKLTNIINLLVESKAMVNQAKNILIANGFDEAQTEDVVKKFEAEDKSPAKKYMPLMAILYVLNKGDNIGNVMSLSKEYMEMLEKNRIGNYEIKKVNNIPSVLVIKKDGNVREFTDFLRFSEYLHGIQAFRAETPKISKTAEDWEPTNDEPMMRGDGIDVYDARNIGRCIEYTQGSLTGEKYSFCIGRTDAQNQYYHYRFTQGSTFYFIVDKNYIIEKPNGEIDFKPLHLVVYDVSENGVELTDAKNTTGIIDEPFGRDVKKYQDYLKERGIEYSGFTNRPRTVEEKWAYDTVKNENKSVEFFEKLIDYGENRPEELHEGDLPQGKLRYLKLYVTLGHDLSDEQFDFIFDGAKKEKGE